MKKYFYSIGDEKHGPFSIEELAKENISKDTLIWHQGLSDWRPAKEISEVLPALEVMPPPIQAKMNSNLSSQDSKISKFSRNNMIIIAVAAITITVINIMAGLHI